MPKKLPRRKSGPQEASDLAFFGSGAIHARTARGFALDYRQNTCSIIGAPHRRRLRPSNVAPALAGMATTPATWTPAPVQPAPGTSGPAVGSEDEG